MTPAFYPLPPLLPPQESSYDGSPHFDASVKNISNAVQQPRVIRFLRGAGLSSNLRLSAAEVILLSSESSPPSAKFIVESNAVPGGGPAYLKTVSMDLADMIIEDFHSPPPLPHPCLSPHFFSR